MFMGWIWLAGHGVLTSILGVRHIAVAGRKEKLKNPIFPEHSVANVFCDNGVRSLSIMGYI